MNSRSSSPDSSSSSIVAGLSSRVNANANGDKKDMTVKNAGVSPEPEGSPSKTKYSAFFDSLSPSNQFIILAGIMFLFFGMHNVLQEAMMKVDGFNGIMLSYMEVLG